MFAWAWLAVGLRCVRRGPRHLVRHGTVRCDREKPLYCNLRCERHLLEPCAVARPASTSPYPVRGGGTHWRLVSHACVQEFMWCSPKRDTLSFGVLQLFCSFSFGQPWQGNSLPRLCKNDVSRPCGLVWFGLAPVLAHGVCVAKESLWRSSNAVAMCVSRNEGPSTEMVRECGRRLNDHLCV